ncbi:MAG: FAD-dependent oxidoreductase [bacterium]|nr:MAG: FAD-dependent oxidoreductase [bacterium]
MNKQFTHIVAVIGAGVSGSEAAKQLAARGITTVLFEKNKLPYGKIEEGLPKWHIKLRNQEERKIDEKIKNPLITFVPATAMGKDFSLREIFEWGFSAVILAIGAGQDRRLKIPGIDFFLGKGFYYQNELVSWFNHKHEPEFQGPFCEIVDGAVVIGGGLASLDVAKILMLETVSRALWEKDIKVDLFTLEREGFPIVFKKYGLTLSGLGLKGCQLFYRRRLIDMPLAPMPEHADNLRMEKVHQLRVRILDNFRQKYMFRVEECLDPVKILSDSRKLQGLVFRERELQGKKWQDTTRTKEIYTPLIISSIGSVPGLFDDLPADGALLAIENQATGKLRGLDNVFAIGNAVTGRGNIKESLVHSRDTVHRILDEQGLGRENSYEDWINREEVKSARAVQRITREIINKKPLSISDFQHTLTRVNKLQKKAGYHGDYDRWIKMYLPIRLETILEQEKSRPG